MDCRLTRKTPIVVIASDIAFSRERSVAGGNPAKQKSNEAINDVGFRLLAAIMTAYFSSKITL
jgi:hypothetical protein